MTKSFKLTLTLPFMLHIFACAIEHKRDYDEDKAMQFYLSEKQKIEPQLNEAIKICDASRKNAKASIRLSWNLNKDGQPKDILISNDSLRCPEANKILREHLKDLRFPRPQPLDKVQFEYEYHF